MKGQPSAEPREVTQVHSVTLPKSVEFSFSTPNSQTVSRPLPGPQHCAKLHRQNLLVIYTGSECQSTSISVANAITVSKSSSSWVQVHTHSPVRIAVVIPSISNSPPSLAQSLPTCRRVRQVQAAAELGVSPEQAIPDDPVGRHRSSYRFTSSHTHGQATNRSSFSSSGGAASAHEARTIGQRVRKPHPEGLLIGVGMSPTRWMRSSSRARGSARGTAESNAREYGCFGWLYTESVGPISTMLPRYITAILSEICRTTDRSWAIKR